MIPPEAKLKALFWRRSRELDAGQHISMNVDALRDCTTRKTKGALTQ